MDDDEEERRCSSRLEQEKFENNDTPGATEECLVIRA